MTTEKRVALITGANKGMGLEIARQLGTLGIAVVLGSRDAGPGEDAARQLMADGIGDVYALKLDVQAPTTSPRCPPISSRSSGDSTSWSTMPG